MAKKKKKPARGSRLWQAEPSDAIRLAALRWFGLEMERIAIEIYATNQAAYPEMELVFRRALSALDGVRATAALEDGDCPEGYVLCKDKICAPMCDGIVGASGNRRRGDDGRDDD